FRSRLGAAQRDVQHGLSLVLEHFDTPQGQDRAVHILKFKLDVLWAMLDAMYLAYVVGMPPYSNIEAA
ncbi:MAG TPA: pyrroloquinoline quinone biosynthesis protein C, partial [Nitrococcus sp.]|nr:pyrroloquinoline quinone biosynthesis protein C [Nitrococcus sp.]